MQAMIKALAFAALLAPGAAGSQAQPAHVQPTGPTLVIAVSAPVMSIDPHYHNLTPNLALARHIFSGLTDTDEHAKVIPALAESWRLVDDRTWEFKGLDAPKWDAAHAKQLLAEAGYPGRLRTTLHGPNDRYVNDAATIQAIGQMWSRAGIQATVEPSPWTNFIGRAGRQELSVFLVGWGNATGEGTNPLRSLVATVDPARGFGVANRGHYSNPAVDALLAQALGTAEGKVREPLVQQATQLAMEDASIISIHIQKNIWGTKPSLQHTPRVDEETRAMDVRPK